MSDLQAYSIYETSLMFSVGGDGSGNEAFFWASIYHTFFPSKSEFTRSTHIIFAYVSIGACG